EVKRLRTGRTFGPLKRRRSPGGSARRGPVTSPAHDRPGTRRAEQTFHKANDLGVSFRLARRRFRRYRRPRGRVARRTAPDQGRGPPRRYGQPRGAWTYRPHSRPPIVLTLGGPPAMGEAAFPEHRT